MLPCKVKTLVYGIAKRFLMASLLFFIYKIYPRCRIFILDWTIFNYAKWVFLPPMPAMLYHYSFYRNMAWYLYNTLLWFEVVAIVIKVSRLITECGRFLQWSYCCKYPYPRWSTVGQEDMSANHKGNRLFVIPCAFFMLSYSHSPGQCRDTQHIINPNLKNYITFSYHIPGLASESTL